MDIDHIFVIIIKRNPNTDVEISKNSYNIENKRVLTYSWMIESYQ